MEPAQFDSMVKRLAGWSSRRRFLGALTGAAAFGAIAPRGALAQTSPASFPCGDKVDDNEIKLLLPKIAELGALHDQLAPKFDTTLKLSPYANGTQFYVFAEAVDCLLVQARSSSGWQSDEVRGFLNQIKGITAAFSVGFGGALYSDLKLSLDAPSGVRAQNATANTGMCATGCTADVLTAVYDAYNNCNDADSCIVQAFNDLVQKYFLDDNACVTLIDSLCTEHDDCCVGVCSCGHCIPPR